MRSIFDKSNNKAQTGMIMGLMFLVMTIVVLSAFLPIIKEVITTQRGQNNLNCKQSLAICGVTANGTDDCYNSSKASETTSCLIFDIYLPYILIVVLVGGVAGLLARSQQPPQQQYGGYYG